MSGDDETTKDSLVELDEIEMDEVTGGTMKIPNIFGGYTTDGDHLIGAGGVKTGDLFTGEIDPKAEIATKKLKF